MGYIKILFTVSDTVYIPGLVNVFMRLLELLNQYDKDKLPRVGKT